MRPSSRSDPRKFQELLAAEAWLREMEEEGAVYGPKLLAEPAGEWPALFASDPHYRSYGTLMYLLEHAHENLEQYPANSYELVAAILPFVDSVDAPVAMYRDMVRGIAWKERGNTLFSRNLREAKIAACTALDILDSHAGLAEELAKARLLRAKIHREQGETALAMLLVRQCAKTFKEFGNTKYYGIARFIEAWIYFGQKQFREAYGILTDLVAEAERGGNELALGRALHFTAMCAVELGEHATARVLRARALQHFEAAKATAELPRVRWAHAGALAAEGRSGEAIFELYKVRSEFLSLGMIISAASASLDMVRLKTERGEDVTSTARELVTTFVEAGMTPNAVEALAYIREQARAGALTMKKIEAARDFLKSLERQPAQLFAPPSPYDREET